MCGTVSLAVMNGAAECSPRARFIAERSADETQVVPGGVKVGVVVDGALELARRVLREILLDEKRAELVVQYGRVGSLAQRRQSPRDAGIHVAAGVEELFVKRRFVRILVLQGRASGEGERNDDDENWFHCHSWMGFAFSLTLPSTVSTRKPTAETL